MYAKLAFRNVRRSLRDYMIYFITLTLTAALMYSFLALGFSEDIVAMTENMSMLTSGILLLSVVIAFLSSFIIGYAVWFMLGQRKKEFATYELMGMEGKTVRNLFLAENSMIGIGAFLLGTLLGTGLSGLLNQVVKNIFEVPHSYRVSFSLRAWAVTFLFFALMYGFGMFRAAKVLRRQKVIDLLYDNRKNEEYRFKSLRRSMLTVLLSIASMTAGMLSLGKVLHTQTNEAFLYLGGACLLVLAGVYELHRQIPLLLHQVAKRNQRYKYKGENLFFLGQIGRRLQSAGRTMAVASILLTVSLAAMFVGLTMGAGYKANMKAHYPYDAGVAVDAPLTKASMSAIISFTEKHSVVEDSVTYYLYAVPDESIEALALSDYNHLRRILGLSPVSMGNGEFFVHCDTWNYLDGIERALEKQPEITLNGCRLTARETPVLTEPMEQYQMAGTKGYVLVLPDEAAQQLSGGKIRLVMKLKDGGSSELKSELKRFLNSGWWQPELQSGQEMPEKVTMGVTVKAWGVANSLTGFTAISFCGLYLSIIFIIFSCSILAFEQLSAIDRNRKNYEVIDRIGVEGQKQASLIHRELATAFFIPLFFPIVLTVLLIAGAHVFYGEAILQEGLVLFYGLVTILVFCVIYLIYFSATLSLFRRVILRPAVR